MFRRATVFALALILSAPVLAEAPPTHRPQDFDVTGVINHLDVGSGEIVISDHLLRFGPTLRVAAPRGANGTVARLRVGQKVGVLLGGPDGRSLTGLWLLP